MMSAEEKSDLIRALHRLRNTGDFNAIPLVYSDEFVGHWPKGWGTGDSLGHDGVREALDRIRSAFPDWNEEVVDLIVGKDRVVTRYVSTGTHRGEFAGISPTGKRVQFEEISIYRIEEGRVVEQGCMADDILLSNQLRGIELIHVQ